jgi:lantibiotic modifying enzyme
LDGTIAMGGAGIVIGLSVADFASARSDFDQKIIHAAGRLARSERSGPAFGLFTGQAGIAFALALLGRKYARNDFLQEAAERFAFAADQVVEADLFCGSAGIVWGACILASVLDVDWPLKAADRPARRLKRSVREDEGLLVWRSPGRPIDEAYFGAAHGSAGIGMALAAWAQATGRVEFRQLARAAFARLYRHGRTSERHQLRYQANSTEGADNGTWCHGAAGYLWCMLQAFGDDKSLREPIDWAYHAFSDVPLVGNPSYCHGMAGQLDLWRLLGRYPRFARVAKQRAALAATLLEHLGYRSEGSWTWLGDQLGETNPTLWTGSLGPACALALYEKGTSEPLFSPELLRHVFQPKGRRTRFTRAARAGRRSPPPSASG